MSLDLEIKLDKIDDIALVSEMIDKQAIIGAKKIVIKPFFDAFKIFIGYNVEYHYQPNRKTIFYSRKR